MTDDMLRQKVMAPISTQELERRWAAVRDRMAEHKVDFLVVHNHNDYLGGYVKWFTDEPAMHCYPISVIFPVDDEMTTVCHGSSDPALAGPPAWALRGVKKRMSTPVMHALNYAATLDAELIAAELAAYPNARICTVNEDAMTAGFVRVLRKRLTSAEFVDITDEIDLIKAIKSDEEIERIKENALLHDEALAACFAAIEPGVREFEVAAAGRNKCLMLGSEQQIIFVASAPPGTPLPFNMPPRHEPAHREGRPGRHTGRGQRCLGFLHAPVAHRLSRRHPGRAAASPRDRAGGPEPEPRTDPTRRRSRGNPQGQQRLPAEPRPAAGDPGVRPRPGYDMVERPSFQPGETMKIAANMNIAVHPAASGKRASAILTDNYIVTGTGVSECIHKTPKKVFSL
ncbi:MAG: aminopeptidase P family N-terminal domain-containing protein [Gammaproteobacteria bacterium]|nr:aminopeptidase P family N-terminal domain-containing protein [Gammaproteobacteria bacterium]